MTSLKLILFCIFWSPVQAGNSGTDHCHFKNETTADCVTFSSVITPDLSRNIQFLNIHYTGKMAKLNSTHLYRYKRLEQMKLSGNFESIDYFAFRSQLKLKSLQITETLLTTIPDDLFNGNRTSLHELNLRQNKLKKLPIGMFRFLKELRVLSLADNCIKLDDCVGASEQFKHLKKLSSLNIAGLSIGDNCSQTSANLLLGVNKRLMNLNISSTNVTDIYSVKVSNHLSSLDELDLSSPLVHLNQCATHAWTVFEHLPETLTKIYLRKWRSIEKPQPNCFLNETTLEGLKSLPNLTLIDMHSSDSIFGPTLYRTTFASFRRLKILNLSWCRIWDVEDLAFGNSTRLRTLIMDGNPIGSKAVRLQNHGQKIQHLSLRHIGASSDPLQTHVPILSLELPSKIKSLDASNNFLHEFPLFSIRINGTTRIRETGCQQEFDKVPVLHTPSIQSVTLDNNDLTRFLPKYVVDRVKLCKNMSQLVNVSIRRNRLENLDGLCWSIKRLQLSHNFIGRGWYSNSKALRDLHKLEYLDLSHNTIWWLNVGLLSKMSNLVEFRFAGNNMTSIPENLFSKNPKLKLVDLSSNQLANIEHPLISGLPSLNYFYLRSNAITFFNKELIDVLSVSSVQVFEVAGNEFDCGCEDYHWYFRNWLKNDSKRVFVPEYRQLTCRLQGNQTVYTYTRDVFRCDWLIPIIATSSTIACIALTILIALPCYKYRWYIRHARVVWRAIINQIKSIRFDQNCKYDAYVSYNTGSNMDTEFVVDSLLPVLENSEDKVRFIKSRNLVALLK